jgi:hypothetical protein
VTRSYGLAKKPRLECIMLTLLNTTLLFHVKNIFLCCFILEIVYCMMLKILIRVVKVRDVIFSVFLTSSGHRLL